MKEIPAFKKFVLETGKANGVPERVTMYFWDVLCQRQLGYAFSVLHSAIYSFMAVQCAWLNYKFSPIYWQTACLIVDSGAFETDYYVDDEMEEEEILKMVSELKERNTDYGKLSTAISNFQQEGVEISLPDINKSHYIFEPDKEHNTIFYGLKGIKKVNKELIEDIIKNRPYASLEDFLEKVKVQRTVGYNLIKAGCFDNVEQMNRKSILAKYSERHAKQIKKATLVQAKRLHNLGFIPDVFVETMKKYDFNRYIRQKHFKTYEDYYILDERAITFFNLFYDISMLDYVDSNTVVNRKAWEKIYKAEMAPLSTWIKDNSEELTMALNAEVIEDEYENQGKGTLPEWEMETLSFYYTGHELDDVDYYSYNSSNFFNLPEKPEFSQHSKGRFKYKKLKLTRIMGTVLEKNKNRHTVALLTRDGVVQVKFHASRFAKYEKQISELNPETGKKKIVDKSWFAKGTKLLISGYRRGDQFACKCSDGEVSVYKIVAVNDGELELSASRDLDKLGVEEWV